MDFILYRVITWLWAWNHRFVIWLIVFMMALFHGVYIDPADRFNGGVGMTALVAASLEGIALIIAVIKRRKSGN